MRLPVPRLLLLACALLAVLLVPASAIAKTTKRTYPVIKKVTPLKIAVGGQLTIRGTGFKAGNVHDFCERWGKDFNLMLPLDDLIERQRVRNAFVIAQVALALILLVGSGLLARSFQRMRASKCRLMFIA